MSQLHGRDGRGGRRCYAVLAEGRRSVAETLPPADGNASLAGRFVTSGGAFEQQAGIVQTAVRRSESGNASIRAAFRARFSTFQELKSILLILSFRQMDSPRDPFRPHEKTIQAI